MQNGVIPRGCDPIRIKFLYNHIKYKYLEALRVSSIFECSYHQKKDFSIKFNFHCNKFE